MGRPMIGITWGRNVVKRSAGLGENLLRYQDLLVRAELTPVVITPGTGTEVLSRLEGLMIPGGPDIAPSRYGAAPHPRLERTAPDLDELEITLVRGARELSMPVLGICRGQQLVNVAFGGTLHQHISHPEWGSDPAETVHGVDIVAATHLHEVLGVDRLDVNSGHHQAVDTVAPDFVVSAVSSDGFIEAIEAPNLRVMAVQWHPEEIPDAESTERLMSGFARWVS
jgi:putative glutamine amidotransferase